MIHQYKNNGYNIVMDVNSGAVHVVDEVTYDVISMFEEKTREEIIEALEITYAATEIEEAYEEVKTLKEEEQLFTEDIYEKYMTDFKNRKTVVKAMCLHIAHDCNLACRYCFAEEGEYHGRRALMSLEVGKKALDFLIENSGSRVNLEVDFFGGEPLMNWDVVKELVKYGRSREKECNKNFRFTLTTNGVLLNDEIMEFANKEMANVVMSLDGRPEVNDFNRPFRNGKGSYEVIVPKFQELAKQREDMSYYVEVYALREEDLPKILEEYDKLAVEYIKRKKEGKGFNFFHFNIDLEQGPCVAKRLSGCGSGTEYLAVTPWGDFYPCHQFVGNEEFLMGNVYDGITRTDIQDEFKMCNVYAKPKCRECFARYYCSGGCAANAYNFHGNINDAYDIGCEMQRKRVECSIMIKAALADYE